jgi:hypothetical protein
VQFTLGQYEFSAVLRDFAINRFSYYNKNRVFYSRDIDFRVHDVRYSLADSLYFIHAAEIGFSLMKSRLYGTNISLRPNFHSYRLKHARQGDFFQIDIPAFSVEGINLYAALKEEQVHLSKVELNLARLKIFHNTSAEALTAKWDSLHHRKKKPFNKADLYTVISGKLKSVSMDSLFIREASLEYYRNFTDNNPELRVAQLDIDISDFRLDSLAHKRRDRIFYAGDFDLRLHDIILNLRDQIHVLNAGKIHISTKNKLVEMEEAMLFPDEKKNLETQENKKNTFYILIPALRFNNIDLMRAFHNQDLLFTSLHIETPDVKFTKYRPSVNKEARFRKPGDFFQESNDDAVYNLLKKYVNSIQGDTISVSQGFLSYYQHTDSLEQKISSGTFNLTLFEFLIDSVHGMNQQGYFYSHDFDFNLKSFTYMSPDSLRHLEVGNVHISTPDSLIEADSITFQRTRDPGTSGIRRKSNASVSFGTDHLHLLGLNHKKLFLEKILKAKTLILSDPRLSIKAGDQVKIKENTDDERIASSQRLVKFLDVEKLIILKGELSFDALERTQSSYFKLKDIDFTVKGLSMKLPDRGKLNGSMRFDSVDLSVRPLRMIVLDSTYEVRCDNISLNSYPLNIHASGVMILPVEPASGQTREKTKVMATIPDLKINNFYFDKALFSREWIIGSILVSNPRADISIFQKAQKNSPAEKIPLALKFNPAMGSFKIDSIRIKNAIFNIRINRNDTISEYRLNDLQVAMRSLLIDSVNREGSPGVPLFNARDISLSARGMSFPLMDSIYTIGFRKFRLSTEKKNFILDSLSILPNYPDTEFYKKTGFQTDRFSVIIPRIEFVNLNIGKLISEKAVSARSLVLSNPGVEAYRDKRITGIRPGKRLLPQSQIRKIPFPVTIDSIIQTDGYLKYEEQTGKIPGMIFFDRMNAVMINFSNETPARKQNPVISMTGTSRFMGKGRMTGHYFFDMVNPRDSTWWYGNVDSVDLKDINPMLSRLFPAKVSHGFVDNASIKLVSANDHTAVGNLEIRYRDLYVELELIQHGFLKKWKNEIITDIANILLPDDNPDYKGKLRTGIIYFERDTTKGFFNYVWKSALSGLKSTIGFNSQEQLQIKMQHKRKAK